MDGAGSLRLCSSLEEAKKTVKKEVDSRRYKMLCFKFNEDNTGAKTTLCDDKGEQEEIRTFVFDIDVAPERLRCLDFYINSILIEKIVFGEVSKAINDAVEANKVKVLFKDTEFECTSQLIKDDELKELQKFCEKVQCANLSKIQYIDTLEEQNINPTEKTSFF